jgi:membrane protease subunit HflC
VPLAGIVNADPQALQFERVEREILDAARPEALRRYGIRLEFLGLRKLSLPEAITEKVFERMRAERREVADQYRSEGEAEAVRIRAEADSAREQKLAAADAEARRIRAAGDAKAAEHYRVFAADPELAIFLRKLEVLEQTLGEKSTVVVSEQTEPFDLLGGDRALPAPPAPPGEKR